MGFIHRKLDVFHLAVELAIGFATATRNVPPQWWWLQRQLMRAAGSVALNIAEGSAEAGTPQERKFYRIARGSAAECDAALLLLDKAGLVEPAFARDAETGLNRVSAMLRSLIKASQRRSSATSAFHTQERSRHARPDSPPIP